LTGADGIVGTLNGMLGGATGFAGIVLTIWCTLRGWPPPEQRAVFQPVGVFVFLLTALFLGGTGTIAPGTGSLFLIGLPAMALVSNDLSLETFCTDFSFMRAPG
jgi:hypothetical protein